MKEIVLKICRWLLPLLGISTISSCGEGSPFDGGYAMYGTPTMNFRVKGKVVDKDTGNPIKDISVNAFKPKAYDLECQTVTDENGGFEVLGHSFPSDTVYLKFTDVDGDDNGGSFVYKEQAVYVKKIKKGDGAWDAGDYEADEVEIKMKKL